jgi:predicted RNase H-like HicB family nuclease
MKFPIAIEPGDERTAWGVVVPDLPGCFSAGDSAEEAFANAQQAIDLHLQTLIEDGQDLPSPKPLAHWQAQPEFAGWVWALIEVNVGRFEGKAEKINITLPRRLLARVDDYARAHGETRSGFLARAARQALEQT